jgi:hypothetical protein
MFVYKPVVLCVKIEVKLTRKAFELTTLVVIGTDWIGICKSNYRTITTASSHLTSTLYLIYLQMSQF